MSNPNPDENREEQEAEIVARKEQALRVLLSPEARLRLNNVKLVKPEIAMSVENYIINMASQGKFNSQLSDDQLKQILQSLQKPKHEFKINRL
ncbi:MAG: DNA-binding protein [Thaumarchaeota archaeon]|nr:MAG: DNA-binding protein [Nitrosopumilales archaeon]MCZ6582594.1 DNA-binding protein [Nitrososphaerota archaeon]GFN39248.1 MAG: DNA-binding protein CENSYa_1764 [Marine Group I thaumarchaeote]